MSTSTVRPAFNTRNYPANDQARKLEEQSKVRFLFSPLLVIDCRYDQAAFKYIYPGEITTVDLHRLPIPNTKRITEGSSSAEPEIVWSPRLPGVIADRILSNNAEDDGVATGLVDLRELIGLDPNRHQDHRELVLDIQNTLWPETYVAGREQMEALLRAGELVRGKDPVYAATLQRLITSVETALAYGDVVYMNLLDELSQRAAGGEGGKGRRNKADAEERRICAYIGKDVPVLASPLVQNRVAEIQKAAPAVVAPAIAQVQCLNCGAMSNLIVATGKPPKLCSGCGNEFEQDDKPKTAKPKAGEQKGGGDPKRVQDDPIV